MSRVVKVDRRDFMKVSAVAAGGLVLGVHVPLREAAVEEGAELFAHAPIADHSACHICRRLNILSRTGGDFIEDNLLCHTAPHQDGDLSFGKALGDHLSIFEGELLSQSQCSPPRDDGDLVHRISAGKEPSHNSVPGLVKGTGSLLGILDDHGTALRTHHYLVF